MADIPAGIHQALSPQNPLWLGVSGGRDSMALLHICHQLNLPIHAIHVNHQLQPPSDDWQAMVADFCQKNAIPFTAISVDWEAFFLSQQKPIPPLSHINEQYARQARYQAIISVIEQLSPTTQFPNQPFSTQPFPTKITPILALAHHANDQAETILLNLLQGTGLTGLTGIKSWTLQQEFARPLWLWRPLLTVSREQISEYVSEQNIPFVDDPTNITGDNQRAFLRQEIIPKLSQRFGNAVQNIARTRQNLSEISEIIDEQVQIDLQHCQVICEFSGQTNLSILALKKLSHARRLQLLRCWLKGAEKFAPSRDFVLQVNDLALQTNPDQQAVLQWQGVAIRRYRDSLYRLSPSYLAVLNQQNISVALTSELVSEEKFFQHLPITIRSVNLGESFARWSQKPFHESYKKLCQRFDIPSWERGLGRVVELGNTPIALLLPRYSLWLIGAEILVTKGFLETDKHLSNSCVWYIVCDFDKRF